MQGSISSQCPRRWGVSKDAMLTCHEEALSGSGGAGPGHGGVKETVTLASDTMRK